MGITFSVQLQSWRSKADTLGAEPAEEVKLEDHCSYRYLFNFRGVAASFRFKHLFLCNSTGIPQICANNLANVFLAFKVVQYPLTNLKHFPLIVLIVLHVGSEWKEFFYDALIPWYHYIPIPDDTPMTNGQQHDQSEAIEDVLQFLQTDESVYGENSGSFIAEHIAANGRHFIENHLKMEDVELYWHELLLTYSKLLDFVPTKNPSFVEILK